MTLPTLALFTGDPAGIGPELVAKLLSDSGWQQHANVILIAQEGALQVPEGVTWLDWAGRHAPAFPSGVANADNGRFMLQALALGLDLVMSGQADAFCFAPLNKSALRQGGMTDEDELRWFAQHMHYTGVCGELNVLKNLWTSRVTSHVALHEVSSLLSADKVADAIRMISQALSASGIAQPRVAVCGLNPHNGDNGNYGDEEGRIIEPGVQKAAAWGFAADGPFPADTVFVRAIRPEGGYDGVVTMYHDQGQIAMKLMGFEQGVTVHGGLPCPITTPAHGTAYDIVGRGIANPQAMRNAFELAARMATSHREKKSTNEETLS
jgi:4-hydroxy-L-threonine phosphate dehydrogenase PdxA